MPKLSSYFPDCYHHFSALAFGEIIPKVYAAHYPKNFALKIAPFIDILGKITKPVNYILIHSTSFVNKRMSKHRRVLSINEISKALKLANHEDLSDDKDILEGIVKFGSKSVSEIMHSRLDMVVVDFSSNFSEVLEIIVRPDIHVFLFTLEPWIR